MTLIVFDLLSTGFFFSKLWRPLVTCLCWGIVTEDLKTMIALGPALRFHGGGHLNHSIFWQNLSPNGGGEPEGELMSAIQKDFGSFENFKNNLSAATVAIQGSGWGWLGYNKTTKTLAISTQPNQDPLEAVTGNLLFNESIGVFGFEIEIFDILSDVS